MTLQGSIEFFRQRQADLFTTGMVVNRGVAPNDGSYNNTTNTWSPDTGEEIWSGLGLALSEDILAGMKGESFSTIEAPYRLYFPVDVDVDRGDTVQILTTVNDAQLAGKTLWVIRAYFTDWQIARVALATDQHPASPR